VFCLVLVSVFDGFVTLFDGLPFVSLFCLVLVVFDGLVTVFVDLRFALSEDCLSVEEFELVRLPELFPGV
jgi:hypothetical protein